MGKRRFGLLACLVLAVCASGSAAASEAAVTLPLPTAGNVGVSRFTIEPSSGIAVTPPRLAVANGRAIGKRVLVVAALSRSSGSRFVVTIGAIRDAATESGQALVPRTLTVRVPSPFRVVSAPQTASDVLYQNPAPRFPFVAGGTGTVLAGAIPGKLPAARLVQDAQLLAFDRAVPMADTGLIGLPYVTAHVPTARTKVSVVVGLTRLNQVNALELQFPTNAHVVQVTGPEGTSNSIVSASTVQLVASTAFFQEGVPYPFTVTLSRPLRGGEHVTLRASTHYFESVLPFTERFVLG